MEQEIFRFVAVRAARPLAQDRWKQVRTRWLDADIHESPADVNSGAAVLERLSRWLADDLDQRTSEEVARWVAAALRLDEDRAWHALRALVASDSYRTARDDVSARVASIGGPVVGAPAPVTDEPAVRILLVCGLLERLATRRGSQRLRTAGDIASWLATALVIDDGQPGPEESSGQEQPLRNAEGDTEWFAEPAKIPIPDSDVGTVEPFEWRPYMALARPPRLGELIVVERELCGYEMGEVADIENVLEGERKEHVDRDLDISEQEVVEETEQTVSRLESIEARDESRMRSEAEQTMQNDTRFDASLNVEARYPPYVTVTADAGFQLNNSRTQTDRTTAEVAREVTSTTAKRVTDRELVRRINRTRRERERRYQHRFSAPDSNVVGVYRFVDAVWTARSVRYDPPRLQCEFVVPEPAAWLRTLISNRPPVTIDMPKPVEPVNANNQPLSPTDITLENWSTLVASVRATGVPPPPEPVIQVARSFRSSQDPPTGTSGLTPPTPPTPPMPLLPRAEVRDTLNLPEGYRAVSYKVTVSGLWWTPPTPAPSFTIMVGDANPVELTTTIPLLSGTASGNLSGIVQRGADRRREYDWIRICWRRHRPLRAHCRDTRPMAINHACPYLDGLPGGGRALPIQTRRGPGPRRRPTGRDTVVASPSAHRDRATTAVPAHARR